MDKLAWLVLPWYEYQETRFGIVGLRDKQGLQRITKDHLIPMCHQRVVYQ